MLIKCPECGREKVSDSAEICPECGFGIKEHFKKLEAEKIKQEKERIETERLKEIKRQAKLKNEEEKIKTKKEIEKKKPIAQDKLKKLQKYVSERKKRTCVYVLITFVSFIMAIISLHNSIEDIYERLFIVLLCCGSFLIFLTIREYLLLKSAKENFEEGKNILQALEKGENVNIDMMDREPTTGFENVPAKGFSYIGVSCPVCHSTNVKRISTTNRAISIGAVGLASGKIGKQYQCKNCKHMW